MNRLSLCIVAFALVVFGSARVSAQTTKSPLPAPTGYINDYAKVIDAETEQQLEATLTKLDQQQQIQFAVVTVDSTNGTEIFDYSIAVARGWGIGAKDVQKPSLLLLVAIKDRKYYTQVSRHLEGDLPDGLVGQIQREKLVPAFRASDYGRGITDTVNEYISTVARKRGFNADTILGPTPTPVRRDSGPLGAFGCCPILVVIAVVIIIILLLVRRGGGRGIGGSGGSWWTWLLVSSLLNSGRGSGSGWSGGGFGGFGGGSSGGGGGFGGFGGGGDFGGGGSGGSW